jgi:phospholipase C
MMRTKSLLNDLENDMTNGNLPQVSWIIAPTHLSEHASHHPAAGEHLTSQILGIIYLLNSSI